MRRGAAHPAEVHEVADAFDDLEGGGAVQPGADLVAEKRRLRPAGAPQNIHMVTCCHRMADLSETPKSVQNTGTGANA